MDSHRFAEHLGSWVECEGPECDVVVSCRTRLARNIAGYPFVSRLEAEQAVELSARLHAILSEHSIDGETIWVAMHEAPVVVRLLLRERHLVSRDLAPSDQRRTIHPGRAVAFGVSETVSAMINEEDHLRLQGLSSGYDLQGAWKRVRDLDVEIEGKLDYAHSERLGYLTGCPTNVGTGLRASVMLHLPALGLMRTELEKVFNAAQRTSLAVRGMYGEGSRAAGEFYQISNQVTLGRTEAQLIDDLENLVPSIIRYERRVREVLLEEHRTALRDRVDRASGLLRTATSTTTEAALANLSTVRLGASLGLLPEVPLGLINSMAIQIQKGHIQALNQASSESELLELSERDRLRATFLRQRFADRL